MDSDEDTRSVEDHFDAEPRLVPIGIEEPIKENAEDSTLYLRACLSKQTETINYLKEMAVSANLHLDPTRIIDPLIPPDPFNGWTPDKDDLLQTWRNQLFSSSFVYGVVLEKYNRRFNRIQIITASLSALITMLGVVLSTLGSDNIWVNRGFGIAVAIIGAVVTILTNIAKINGWDTYTATIAKLIQNLDNLYTRVTNESYLPKPNRTPAIQFITEFQKDLNQATQNQPHISVTDYQIAEQLYQQERTRTRNLVISQV
jgi:hypothetical protein